METELIYFNHVKPNEDRNTDRIAISVGHHWKKVVAFLYPADNEERLVITNQVHMTIAEMPRLNRAKLDELRADVAQQIKNRRGGVWEKLCSAADEWGMEVLPVPTL